LKLLFYAGAGLNKAIADEYAALSAEVTGERILSVTSLGSTETAPASLLRTFEDDGNWTMTEQQPARRASRPKARRQERLF